MPRLVLDPLSFPLNQLHKKPLLSPQKAVAWGVRWPAIRKLLHKLDYLTHEETPTILLESGTQLLIDYSRISVKYFKYCLLLPPFFYLFTFMPRWFFSSLFYLLIWRRQCSLDTACPFRLFNFSK